MEQRWWRAAHIHPFSEAADDDPRNGLALTPDMHWALDRYLIAPDTDFRWRVSPLLDPRIPDYRVLTALEGKPLFLPREARMYPEEGGDRVATVAVGEMIMCGRASTLYQGIWIPWTARHRRRRN